MAGAPALRDEGGPEDSGENHLDRLVLALARVALDEQAGDYAGALARLQAAQTQLGEDQGLLAEALRHAAAIERRLPGGATAAASAAPLPTAASAAPPAAFALEGAFPNPTQGWATVAYALPEPARVAIHVYDTLGRRVATLAEGSFEAGRHEAHLDGAGFAAGGYLVRATFDTSSEAHTMTRRFTLVR